MGYLVRYQKKPKILESGCKLSQIDIKVSAKFPGQVFSVVQISAVSTVTISQAALLRILSIFYIKDFTMRILILILEVFY